MDQVKIPPEQTIQQSKQTALDELDASSWTWAHWRAILGTKLRYPIILSCWVFEWHDFTENLELDS